MIFFIPEKMPARDEFLLLFLHAIFPDLQDLECTKTGYGYTLACEIAAKETGLLGDEWEERKLKENTPLFRLMFEMGEASSFLFNKTPYLLEDHAYEHYSDTLFSFCDQTSGSLKGWLRKSGNRSKINKSFDSALFFTYLLLSRKASLATRKIFFERCLEFVGIDDIDPIVARCLFSFDWKELGEEASIKGRRFTRITNKGILFFGTVTLTIFEMIGTYSAVKDQVTIEKLQNLFLHTFKEEVEASKALDKAEEALYQSIKFFEPRSIQTVKKLYPQDFFVPPVFEQNGEKVEMPLSAMEGALKGQRVKIVAKTGMGKSAFLQMASICMLADQFCREENGHSLKKLADDLGAPTNLYLISIPARLFSFCYQDERYREWTKDLVSLFFNSMWRLSEGRNFFSGQVSPGIIPGTLSQPQDGFKISGPLTDYLQELARAGKLLLILDSFDEISSGDMRNAYLHAISAFYDSYCCFPESHEVGAHVIVSSREMSSQTMTALDHALDMDPYWSTFRICPLNEDQRKNLVMKWNRFSNIPEEESLELLEEIRRNHFYQDYSVNPYMLSVVCFYFGHDLGSITQRLITTLVDRMLKNNRSADPVIYDVLMNILKILQEVALETVSTGSPHFSRQKLNRYLHKWIDETGLRQEEIGMVMDRLHEIFITEVGLIVPADGADNDYQFINPQIRFELAAKGIRAGLINEESGGDGLHILSSITDPADYVSLLVPLVCDINLENVQLAEQLIFDLTTRDFSDRVEERILIKAMVDLILNRYGNNISTAAMPGNWDAKYVRRAQRLLLMRIFTSEILKEMGENKEALFLSPAYQENIKWFSRDFQIK